MRTIRRVCRSNFQPFFDDDLPFCGENCSFRSPVLLRERGNGDEFRRHLVGCATKENYVVANNHVVDSARRLLRKSS